MKTVIILKNAKKELSTYENHKKQASRSALKAEKTKKRILSMLVNIPKVEADLHREKINFILDKLK